MADKIISSPVARACCPQPQTPGSMPGPHSLADLWRGRVGKASLPFHYLTVILLLAFLTILAPFVRADGPGRIYTKTLTTDTGAITAKVKGAVLTHALAVERDRVRVYQATLDADCAGFRFSNLPVGRFDLVLVSKDGRVCEGLGLGAEAALPEARAKHLAESVTKADSFFNRRVMHRVGVADGVALVFVERLRDHQILRGSGEDLNAGLRRLEIIELHEADDDWQMVRTRHIYREETPRQEGIPFFTHRHLPALGGLRIAATPRDLGVIDISNSRAPGTDDK